MTLRAHIIVIFLFMIADPCFAGSTTGSLAVSAYITSTGWCTVKSTQNIAFGALYPLNPVDVQASGRVTVNCHSGGGWGWQWKPGSNSNSFTVGVTQVTSSPLTLKNSSNSNSTITYTLDLPTSASTTTSSRSNNIELTIPITATIQGANYKTAPAGSYTDTVTLQITP